MKMYFIGTLSSNLEVLFTQSQKFLSYQTTAFIVFAMQIHILNNEVFTVSCDQNSIVQIQLLNSY